MSAVTGKHWEEALADERETNGDDEIVLLFHHETPKGHIHVLENHGGETECEIGTTPSQYIPVLLRNVNNKLKELGLPVDGWS